VDLKKLFLILIIGIVVLVFIGCDASSTRVIFCQDVVPIILDPIYPSYELRTGTFYVLLEAVQPFGVEEIIARFWKSSGGVDTFVKEVTHDIDPHAEVVALEFEIDDSGNYKAAFLRPDGRRLASGEFSLH